MAKLTMACKVFETFGLSFRATDNVLEDLSISFTYQIAEMPPDMIEIPIIIGGK
jgi:hypothetical protein